MQPWLQFADITQSLSIVANRVALLVMDSWQQVAKVLAPWYSFQGSFVNIAKNLYTTKISMYTSNQGG